MCNVRACIHMRTMYVKCVRICVQYNTLQCNTKSQCVTNYNAQILLLLYVNVLETSSFILIIYI